MAGRRLDDTALRLRRATRHDLAGVRALMAADDTGRSERFDRRVLRQLGGTVAVVEDATGAIVGAVSLAAVRSFRAGHWCAHLDGVWMAPAHAGELTCQSRPRYFQVSYMVRPFMVLLTLSPFVAACAQMPAQPDIETARQQVFTAHNIR